MNESGQNFIKRAEKLLNQSKYKKEFSFGGWTDSLFHQRFARLGREFKQFDLHIGDTSDIEKVVRASLIYSFLELKNRPVYLYKNGLLEEIINY